MSRSTRNAMIPVTPLKRRQQKNIAAGKNEIGEKGIGFKSVFGVSDKVLIRSVWFSFLQSSHLPYGHRAFRDH
ncbi:MAG: hypothetical protein SPE50_06725 [Evtepia sp.]|nr:hypothetical protein [Evtepia sp.]